MENEKRIIVNEKQTPSEIIKDFLVTEKKSFYSNKEVQVILHNFLSLLTDVQRLSISEKVQRCEFYIKRRKLNMEEKKIKGLVIRKFGISRVYVAAACEPCEKIYKNNQNNNAF